jgi:hypothetical protein
MADCPTISFVVRIASEVIHNSSLDSHCDSETNNPHFWLDSVISFVDLPCHLSGHVANVPRSRGLISWRAYAANTRKFICLPTIEKHKEFGRANAFSHVLGEALGSEVATCHPSAMHAQGNTP